MKDAIIRTMSFAAILLATSVSYAQYEPFSPAGPPGPPRAATDVTEVRLESDVKRIVPGQTFHLMIVFKASENWHLYWKNPGAGAASPDVRITAPHGYDVRPIRWPRPKIISSPVGDMYCHEGTFALFVPIVAPPEMRDGAVMFTADISWAVCDEEICLIGNVTRTTTMETFRAVPGSAPKPAVSPLAARHGAHLPVQIDDADDADANYAGGTLTISGPAHGYRTAAFIPNGAQGIAYGEAEIAFSDGRFTATIPVTTNSGDFGRREPRIGGLIMLGEKVTDPSFEIDLPLSGDSDDLKSEISEPGTIRRIN